MKMKMKAQEPTLEWCTGKVSLVYAPALPTYTVLSRKDMQGTNTPAYYELMSVQSFTTLAPGAYTIKLFTAVKSFVVLGSIS
jgi:hypothetical protein